MLGVGCWGVGGAGCWVLGVGCWVLGVGCWVLSVGRWALGVGCWGVGFQGQAGPRPADPPGQLRIAAGVPHRLEKSRSICPHAVRHTPPYSGPYRGMSSRTGENRSAMQTHPVTSEPELAQNWVRLSMRHLVWHLGVDYWGSMCVCFQGEAGPRPADLPGQLKIGSIFDIVNETRAGASEP